MDTCLVPHSRTGTQSPHGDSRKSSRCKSALLPWLSQRETGPQWQSVCGILQLHVFSPYPTQKKGAVRAMDLAYRRERQKWAKQRRKRCCWFFFFFFCLFPAYFFSFSFLLFFTKSIKHFISFLLLSSSFCNKYWLLSFFKRNKLIGLRRRHLRSLRIPITSFP